ncbi:hypothetical protein DFH06DRAFT_1331767 [Mycena polygramma]|nr:hypothetical protein DFH06DRAFT_1331767 [Mycena polygramma]
MPSFTVAVSNALSKPDGLDQQDLDACETNVRESNALVPHDAMDNDVPYDTVKEKVPSDQNISQSVNVQASSGYKRRVLQISAISLGCLVLCRLGRNLQNFAVETGHIKKGESLFTNSVDEKMPELICAWIMNRCSQAAICDSFNLDGNPRDPSEVRLSFANAQKMRAAASWNFGQVENQGNATWRKSELTGKWVGNPSVSTLVSQYMTSLKRRKVHSGEAATIAWALTPSMLEKLYDVNHEHVDEKSVSTTTLVSGYDQCESGQDSAAEVL